jgi:hypothetical protein
MTTLRQRFDPARIVGAGLSEGPPGLQRGHPVGHD